MAITITAFAAAPDRGLCCPMNFWASGAVYGYAVQEISGEGTVRHLLGASSVAAN